MTSSRTPYFTDLVETFGQAWNRFWFTPGDPLPCCVLRIAVGLIAVLHFLTLTGDLSRWYANDGLVPPAEVLRIGGGELDENGQLTEPYYHPSYFNYLGPTEARIVHFIAIGVAAAFTIGLFTRITGLLTFIAVLSYIHRIPMIAGHLEPVLGFLLCYLCIGPSGVLLSVDSSFRRRQPSDLEPTGDSLWANLSVRLIQVHVAAFYMMMGLTKLNGDGWWDGMAIWSLLAQTQSRPVNLSFLQGWEYFINFWTHAVVYYELAFPILIWNRLARPLLLGLGVAIWLSLILASGLLLFGLTMLVAGLAFVPASTYRALLSPAAKPTPALAAG